MLRTLIIAFPIGASIPHIFKMAMILIEANLKEKHDLAMLRLYHFISMEFHGKLSLDMEMRSLFMTNFTSLKEDFDLQNIPYIMLIIEEHILMNVIPYSQFPEIAQFIEERY
jgi:hypothetical protein